MRKTHQLQSETMSPAEWAHTARNDEMEQARKLLLKLEDDTLLLDNALRHLGSVPEGTLAMRLRELELPDKSLDILCQLETGKGNMELHEAAIALKKERQSGADDPSDHINYLDL